MVEEDYRRVDIAALIALWKAIHDGDPPPDQHVVVDEQTLELAIRLIDQLGKSHPEGSVSATLTTRMLQHRLAGLGVHAMYLTPQSSAAQSGASVAELETVDEPEEPRPFTPPMICVEVEGAIYCFRWPHNLYQTHL